MKNKKTSLLRNISCLGVSELAIRITRLGTAIVLARMLTVQEFGVIAIAMTVQEIVQTMTRNGIGAKVVRIEDQYLNSVCNIVYRLNWQISLALFVIQCSVAYPVSLFYKNIDLLYLMIALAVPYLIYPLAMVQVYLVQRQNRMGVTAFANGTQVSLDNLCSAIFVVFGFGVWAVIIPKLIVAPLWVIFYRYQQNWRANKEQLNYPKSAVLSFSFQVLGAEICSTARRHIDKLLIGSFLGLDALGIYYFAINSGIGLSLSLTTAFNTAFYPHLCSKRDDKNALHKEFRHGLLLITSISIVIFGCQAFFAPWYVPLIFGEKWNQAIPILIILTLSGIPRPTAEACSQFLRAINKAYIDFKWNIFFTVAVTISLFFAVFYDIETVAYSILLTHLILIPIYTCGCWFYQSRQPSLKLISQEI